MKSLFLTKFCVLTLVFAIASPAGPVRAQSLEPSSLRKKQEDQQRARVMARELMVGVLDLQLRQLEENELTEMQVYRDIRLMRENIGAIIDTEMSQVVDLLTAAQDQPVEQREHSFIDARKMIRTIVLRLSAERQMLLRRLKTAELSEQVQRLLQMQTVLQDVTRGIPAEGQARQETLALKAVEDQRDVRELFLVLVETLAEVQTWGGPVATGAEDGLRILKAAETGRHLDQAIVRLGEVKLTEAALQQENVLKGLRDLLKIIDRTQGLIDARHSALLEAVRDLAERQQQLRQETRGLEGEKPSDALVEKQAKLQKDLAGLESQLAERGDKASAHAERAAEEAYEATARLFDGEVEAAVSEQSEVLGHLTELENLLAAGQLTPESERSAADWRKQVAALEQTRDKLTAAAREQSAAVETSKADASKAAAREQAALDTIAEAAKAEIGPRLTDRIDAAREAAEAARNELQTDGEKPADTTSAAALASAEDLLDRALAAVEADLRSAKNTATAVEIGEMARAAEVLERAAAQERQLVTETSAAAKEPTADAAEKLAARQRDVGEVAGRLAEAVAEMSPAAAEAIEKGKAATDQAGQKLAEAAKATAAEEQSGALEQAREPAMTAANEFSQAAKQLRTDIAKAAEELTAALGEQGKALAESREKAEGLAAEQATPERARLGQLEAARAKTAAARREQFKAAGNGAAADALELAESLSEAIAAQEQASEMAAAAEKGNMATPLAAAARQQAVADALQSAAEQRTPDKGLAEAVQEARQAAADAARQLLDGETAAASENRAKAEAAMSRAAELARNAARQAEQAGPKTAPDSAAQQGAAGLAREAAELVDKAAPAAAEMLQGAAEAAEGAAAQLAAGENAEATPAQQEASRQLAAAEEQLSGAIAGLQQAQAARMNAQAKAAAEMAREAGRLDMGAGEALQAASQAAKTGAAPEISPDRMQAAADQAERQLERAVANLAAGEQQSQRDQAMAQAIADQVTAQQDAAAKLAQSAAEMAQAAQQGEGPPPQEAVAQAMERFAEALNATGQGAAELSGQNEILNPPLREALELASKLPSLGTPPGGQPAPGEGTVADGSSSPQNPAEGSAEATASDPGQPGQQPSDAGQPGQPGQPGGQPSPSSQASAGSPQQGQQPGSPSMGTGVVPQSAEITAQQILGPEALEALQQAMAAAAASAAAQAGNPSATQNPPPNQPGPPQQGNQTASTNSSALSKSQPGSPTENQPQADSPLTKMPEGTDLRDDRSGNRQGDSDATGRALREEPWFAKLPPELQKSLRGGVNQRAPRAYEERLRKYFQSVD